MVLLAHLIDLVEWAVVLVSPAYFDSHFVTNSPIVAVLIVVAVWAGLAIRVGTRRPVVFVLAGVAVGSHLILDHIAVRAFLVDFYGVSHESSVPGLLDSIAAEVWLFGLMILMVGAYRAARAPGRRPLLPVLAILAAAGAAGTRFLPVWLGAYVLAAGYLFGRELRGARLGWMWNLVPLIPLAALALVETRAASLNRQGLSLQRGRDVAAAAAHYERALALPTRSRQISARVRLATCRRRLGDFEAAEATMLEIIRDDDAPYWADYSLGVLYGDRKARGTRFYRPEEARRRLQRVLAGPAPSGVKRNARRQLDRLGDR